MIEDLTFGGFRLDVRGHSLWHNGRKLPLRSRSLDILRVLAAAGGQLVTKDELMARVWPGVIVEENALQVHVSALRKALGESVGNQRYIVTVPGRGYRFIREPAELRSDAVLPMETVRSPPDRPSIAVLPFQNMSGDPAQDYFADGVVEDIITALTRVPSLSVIARNSSFKYGRGPVDIRQVGRELGARYVLEGSIRKADTRLRITGQLIQAETGIHLWAENFDGDLAHVFRLQDELTNKVVGALLPRLRTAETDRARRKSPEHLDAYDLYLRALARRRSGTREGSDEALRLIEQAIQLDPSFADAAMFLGTTWTLRVTEGWSLDGRAQSKSLRYLRLAVQLDPNGAERVATLARLTGLFGRDDEQVRTLIDRAIALSPNSPDVSRLCGFAFVHIGESQRALDCLQRGLQISPDDLHAFDAWCGVALASIQLQRYQDALIAARKATQGPPYTVALRILASALALVGHREEAQAVVQRLLELEPGCSVSGIEARYGDSFKRTSVRFLDGLRLAGLPELARPGV